MPLLRFLGLRIASSLFALLIITIIVFLLSHLSGNPVDALLPDDATQEQVDTFIRDWGLDEPLWQQVTRQIGVGISVGLSQWLQAVGQPFTR